MKIGIDISQSVYKGTGVGRFTTGLAHAICKHGMGHEWHFFFSSLRQKPDPFLVREIRKAGHILHAQKLPSSILTRMWNDAHIISVERFTGPLDWFITSDWTEPPARCKKATIIHDLVYKRHPETVAPLIRKVQERRLSWVKKESAAIFADSDSTKNDVVQLLGIDGKKVTVNYPAVDPVKPSKETVSAVIKSHNISRPFILTVGKMEPRKNLARLIEAYDSIESGDTELFIVGEKGWGTQPKSGNKKIRFLGYVRDEELAALYSLCEFFIYPSVWEGFGYPVIEAMSAGAAVATSDTSSLKEIGNTHALLFDPHEIPDIAAAMHKLHTDAKLRVRLAQGGVSHAAKFTWKRYYDTLISTLEAQS